MTPVPVVVVKVVLPRMPPEKRTLWIREPAQTCQRVVEGVQTSANSVQREAKTRFSVTQSWDAAKVQGVRMSSAHSSQEIAEVEQWIQSQLDDHNSDKADLGATLSTMENAMLELGTKGTVKNEDLDVDLIGRARAAAASINSVLGNNKPDTTNISRPLRAQHSLTVDTSPPGSSRKKVLVSERSAPQDSHTHNAVAALEAQVEQLTKQVANVRSRNDDTRTNTRGNSTNSVTLLESKVRKLETENKALRKEMEPLPGFFREIDKLKTDFIEAKRKNRELQKQNLRLKTKVRSEKNSSRRWRPNDWSQLITFLDSNDLLDEGTVRRGVFERGLRNHLGLHSHEISEIISSMKLARSMGGQRRKSEVIDFPPFVRVAKILGVYSSKSHGLNSHSDLERSSEDDLPLEAARLRRSRKNRGDSKYTRSPTNKSPHRRHTDNLYSSRRLDEFSSKYGTGLYSDDEAWDDDQDNLGVGEKLYSLRDVERKLDDMYRRREWNGIDLDIVENILASVNAKEEHRYSCVWFAAFLDRTALVLTDSCYL